MFCSVSLMTLNLEPNFHLNIDLSAHILILWFETGNNGFTRNLKTHELWAWLLSTESWASARQYFSHKSSVAFVQVLESLQMSRSLTSQWAVCQLSKTGVSAWKVTHACFKEHMIYPHVQHMLQCRYNILPSFLPSSTDWGTERCYGIFLNP